VTVASPTSLDTEDSYGEAFDIGIFVLSDEAAARWLPEDVLGPPEIPPLETWVG